MEVVVQECGVAPSFDEPDSHHARRNLIREFYDLDEEAIMNCHCQPQNVLDFLLAASLQVHPKPRAGPVVGGKGGAVREADDRDTPRVQFKGLGLSSFTQPHHSLIKHCIIETTNVSD